MSVSDFWIPIYIINAMLFPPDLQILHILINFGYGILILHCVIFTIASDSKSQKSMHIISDDLI